MKSEFEPSSPTNPGRKEAPERYFVSNNGEVKGPYDLRMVEAFILGGYFPKTVDICKEHDSRWRIYSQVSRGFAFDQAASVEPPVEPARAPRSSTPLPTGDPVAWRRIFSVFGFVGFALFGLVTLSSLSSRKPAEPTRTRTSTPTGAAARDSVAPPAASSSQPSKDGQQASDEDRVYKGADGQTYRVSHSDYLRLVQVSKKLEEAEKNLSAQEERLSELDDELATDRSSLDRTSQSAVDSFNQKVAKRNAYNETLKKAYDSFDQEVKAFNDELERVGTPVR